MVLVVRIRGSVVGVSSFIIGLGISVAECWRERYIVSRCVYTLYECIDLLNPPALSNACAAPS